MSNLLNFNEDTLEQDSLEILESLGYEYIHGKKLAPNGELEERDSYREVILKYNDFNNLTVIELKTLLKFLR